MADLIARVPILIGLREYQPGEVLPKDRPDAEAWVRYGSAFWRDEDCQPQKRVSAKLSTAEPGLTGLAAGGEITGEDLAGKVPRTEQRRRPRCKRPVSKT